MKRAFVTGATGFVGINVAQQLLAEDWSVTALHRPTSELSFLKRFDVELAEGSLHDRESLLRAIPEGTDTVFHVAGNTNMWKGGNEQQTRDNVEGTENLVAASIERGVRRMVLTSSVAAYGTHEGEITEETESTAPDSWVNYQRTKWQAEQVLREAMSQGIEAVILNPCVILGPYDFSTWSRMFELVRDGKLKGAPPGEASFCHVREVARAHVAAATRGKNGENYLLGGTNGSYLEMIQIIAELLEKPIPKKAVPGWGIRAVARVVQWVSPLDGQAPDITPETAAMVTKNYMVHSEKAKAELGYQTVPLREVVEDAFHWMKAEGRL